ncbi:hypothetical protein HBH98_250770 [Parastagonospora nodorum]|nr:hypothetical protein HBH98_250770 [Parastagonospora nodorum]KAH4367584.1 hypothetical protein HBH99_250700 [Parastagonospora nodorum]
MLQTNVREGYEITTLEVVELIEDLISYLRNAQISKVFYKAAYGTKVKTEDLSNTLILILSKTAQRQSSFVVFNRSIALITDKFSVALLTKPAILNDANVALVDAVHYSIVIDALIMTLIKNNDDLLGTVNSYIKLRRLRALLLLEQLLLPKKRGRYSKLILDRPLLKRCKTEAADSRYAKASRGRTKKDKDLEDSDTSSDLGKKAQLKKTRDEEELAKLDSLLDSDDYCLDSSSDIDPKDDLEDEEATTAKDLLTDAYILYFKELLSNNSGIFANAIGIGKTRAIVDAIEYNIVNDNNKLYPTKGERTFYCADLLALRFCFFSNSPLENIGRLTKEEVIEMRIDTTNAIFKALAAANKLVALQSYIILEANTPAVHSKATKHRLALLAAQFVIVCSFRKVDKHVFRAYNTISVTAQRTIIRKGGSYIEKRAILLPSYFKTYGSRKVKRFTLNSVKDLFTNLSKDYFLVREARAITKSSLKEKFSDESVLVMQGGITQHEINLKLAK